MTETERHDHLQVIQGSSCLRRAIYALHRLKVGRPSDIAWFINADTALHWAREGAGKFFRVHFYKETGSPYFLRRAISKGNSRYVYELTELGKELAEDVNP